MNEGFRLDSDDKLNDEIADFLGLCGPFCLEWRIENLGHWTREVHGDSLTATVDFKSRRVEYKVYPQCADGRLEVHFPEELGRYTGQLTIKSGHDGRVLSVVRKERGQLVLYGPEFELFSSNVGERLFFFFIVENVSAFLEREHATTVLECVPPDNAIARSLDASDVGQGNIGSLMNPQRPDRPYSHRELCSTTRERMARAEMADQMIRSDDDLQSRLDKATKELKQLTKEIERIAEMPSASKRLWSSRRSSRPGPTVILRRRVPYCPPRRHPTPEQLVPSLRSLSISQGVEQLPLSSDRLEERTPLSPALNIDRRLAKGSQFK